MNRIGHGKGYYDRFIQKCYDCAIERGIQPPILGITCLCRCEVNETVGLALRGQLMDEGKIPMTETDRKMDYIICYGEIISSDP